jgi:uncharacterized protein YcbX
MNESIDENEPTAPPVDAPADTPVMTAPDEFVPDDAVVVDEVIEGPIVFASLASIYRYPVKGLSPERLGQAELTSGQYFPGDRLYAIENGPSGFVPEAPAFQPKIKFLMLMRNERLAALDARYDDATAELVIRHEGAEAVRGNLGTPEGREAIEAFFQRYARYELRGAPRLLEAQAAFVSSIRPKASSR